MKILILNWRDTKNPVGGGAEISLFEHAKYWVKKGSDVTWFAGNFKNAKNKETINGVKFVRKGSAYTVHAWGIYYYLTGKLGKPDIVIDSFHGIPFFSPFYIPKKKIIGLINEIAGKLWFLNAPYIIAKLGYIFEPFIIRLYKKNIFITGSNSTKEELIKVGIPSKHVEVIHHGFHSQKVKNKVQRERTPVILYLGRIAQDKGISDAIEAFRFIKEKVPSARLWIAGGEEKKGTLENLLQNVDKNVRESIMYWGFISEEKKFELLKRTWLLIHPSYKEGWGLTVIEAASQGVPTTGYNVAGLRDSVQQGKTGILVEVRNTQKLAEAVVNIINDKEKYNKFSQESMKWSKRFTWENSVKKSWEVIENVYKKVNNPNT